MHESLGTSASIPLSSIRLDRQTVTAESAPYEAGDAAPAAPLPSTLTALLPGLVYVAASAPDRRWFAVAAAHGIQLVDVRGLHWPADLVVRTLGPLDVVQS